MPQIVYESLGFGGSVIIAFAHIPQILRLFKTKDGEGVSLSAWSLWAIADLMIFIYSISIQDRIFIFLNGTNLLFASTILTTTLFYRWKKKREIKADLKIKEKESNKKEAEINLIDELEEES